MGGFLLVGGSSPHKGDALVIAGATLYAISNVSEVSHVACYTFVLLDIGSCSLILNAASIWQLFSYELLFSQSVTDILFDYSVYNDDLNLIFSFIFGF